MPLIDQLDFVMMSTCSKDSWHRPFVSHCLKFIFFSIWAQIVKKKCDYYKRLLQQRQLAQTFCISLLAIHFFNTEWDSQVVKRKHVTSIKDCEI